MSTPPHAAVPPRRRAGCLGCLGQLLLMLVVGCVFVEAVDFVFAPWAFHLGGRVHLLPFWQGIGRMHGDAGDYVMYVSISPTPSGTSLHLPSVTGWGYLCTPRGERFVLTLGGGFTEKTGADTNGKTMSFYMHRRPWYGTLVGKWDARPRIDLRGRWNNADLELSDLGTVSRAFLRDGTLYSGPERNQPRERERLSLVMREAPWTTWMSDCRAKP